MRWFNLALFAVCALVLVIGGCKKPYNVQLINATFDDIRDVKLDWGGSNQNVGYVAFRKEATIGPLFALPPRTTTLTWTDSGTVKTATADVPASPAGFDGTFFIVLKDDAITVTAVPYGDKQAYERLRQQVPDPPRL